MKNHTTPSGFSVQIRQSTTNHIDAIDENISELVVRLTEKTKELAQKWGVRMNTFELNFPNGTQPNEAPSRMWHTLAFGVERIDIDRIDGQWGVFYVTNNRNSHWTSHPLTSASLDVRRRFLDVSQSFLARYTDEIKKALEPRAQSIKTGTEALEALTKFMENHPEPSQNKQKKILKIPTVIQK